MDTVYGTKKYFQSLSGASDIYRTPVGRAVSNDYTYQNTIGRRSTLGAYYHMNKQPAYTNDLSLNSQYSYNAWGIWRDGRNIAPSTFSTKTHAHYQKTRSFSIILTTAAFIVLLAVISIAGLAFYFSSIKATMEDPVLGFEGSFRIAKGDLFSTGLKYNHTTTYKQKIEFYKRFVERALSDNGLLPLRTDIWGFGEGPLLKVSFRTFLDVRKLPQNIHSVEEYIRESLFLETTAMKSLYRSLRIDAESVEIKRILDEEIVKSASLFKEAQMMPTSQTQLEKRLMKKGGNPPAATTKSPPTSKPRTTQRPHASDDEPDVDVENAPVIQGSFEGSFEITKTDADIARKKVAPTKAYTSLPPKTVTPFALRVKPKKPSIEKLTTIIPQQQPAKQTKTTTQPPTTTPTTTRSTSTTSTTTTTTTTTTKRPTTTTLPPTTTSTTTTQNPTTASTTRSTPTATTTAKPTTLTLSQFAYPGITKPPSGLTVPKLDANLFTSVPVLDTQPWRPIHREVPELMPGPPPAFPTKAMPTGTVDVEPPQNIPIRRIDEEELPFMPDNPAPLPPPQPNAFDPYSPGFFGATLRKPDNSEDEFNPKDMMFYHSFGNPVFMPGGEGIERLGTGASVQPHPLPVPLIDDVFIPPFRPINPTLGSTDSLPFSIDGTDSKFEHLGGGVIVKKHDSIESTEPSVLNAKTTPMNMEVYGDVGSASTTSSSKNPAAEPVDRIGAPSANSEVADAIGEFFMDLLNLPNDDNRTRPTGTAAPTAPTATTTASGTTAATAPTPTTAPTMPTSTTTMSSIESRIEPEDEEPTEEPPVAASSESKTSRPNFMNLKEIILQRNQSPAATTPTPLISSTTTKRTRVRPTSSKLPTILDDSNLFPSHSHSKWEFVNSSSAHSFGHSGNMRKVFNKTLQAWVSEDVEKSENLTLNDIKTRINNATNIQDISLIFDTLASKLGITPSSSPKVPPFSQNKMKQTQKHETKPKPVPTQTSARTASRTTTTTTSTTTTEAPSTQRYVEVPPEQREPFIRPMSSFMEDSSSEGIGAAIPVVGEAEVEVIDPNKYEEMLKSSQFAEPSTTETSSKLVTLLPVRSNSGIRTYRPLDEQRSHGGGGAIKVASDARRSITRKSSSVGNRASSISQARRFPPPEAVVKGGIKVTVK